MLGSNAGEQKIRCSLKDWMRQSSNYSGDDVSIGILFSGNGLTSGNGNDYGQVVKTPTDNGVTLSHATQQGGVTHGTGAPVSKKDAPESGTLGPSEDRENECCDSPGSGDGINESGHESIEAKK